MQVQLLSASPEIVLFGDFLSREEAAGLIQLAEGHFVSSKVTCDKAGGCVSSFRTSATAYLPRTALTTSIASRGMRLARLSFAEDLQIVRYFPGQEFKPHLDAFDPATYEGRQELAGYGGRQRDATFLIYLNEPEVGGSTRFTELGLEVAPKIGTALYWRNVGLDGRIDPRTRHAGMPVQAGVKYAVNLWIRGAKALAGYPREGKIGALRNFSFPTRLGHIPQLGRFGEFKPSVEADAKNFKVAVDRQPYTGTGYTLAKMAAYIREGSISPAMKQFAEMVVRDAGVPASEQTSNLQAAQILLTYVKKNVRYRPDPDNVEMVQSGAISLCVPGAQMCIPVGDCDDATVALGCLMGAYGIPVKILKQTFGSDAPEEHVLIIFRTDDGRWLPADATAPLDVGVGWRANASQEVIVDPLDPGDTGTQASEFVGIGKFEISIGVQRDQREVQMPRQVLKKIKKIGLSSDSYVASLQDLVASQSVRVALAVEACSATLDVATQTNWNVLARRALAFASMDPSTASVDEGNAVLAALNTFTASLVAAGCSSAADVPTVTAPIAPPPGPPPTDWEGIAKLGLYTLMLGVGVYGLGEIVKLAEIGEGLLPHHREAESTAKQLVKKRAA